MSEQQWANCEVLSTGVAEDGATLIQLRSVGGEFPARWFRGTIEEAKKQMLATALTAITTGLHVIVFLESPTEYSQVLRIYVSREV